MRNSLQIGDVIHVTEDYHRVPPGTVIGHPDDTRNRWTKFGDHLWGDGARTTNRRPAEHWLPLGYYRVLTYPQGYTPDAREPLTLRQWQWQFQDGAIGAAEHHGVSVTVVQRLMERLNCALQTFPIGVGVTVESAHTREMLPEGTVLFVGDTEDAALSGTFVKHQGAYRRVLGDKDLNLRIATVVEVPGQTEPPDWVVEKPGPDMDEMIGRFRDQARVLAAKMADNQNWCSTYDQLSSRYGFPRRAGQ